VDFCVLVMSAFYNNDCFYIFPVFYSYSLSIMISIAFWWLLFDIIRLVLATQDDLPDLNYSPPSSPISVLGNIQNYKQSNSVKRPSAFRKWSNDVQPKIISKDTHAETLHSHNPTSMPQSADEEELEQLKKDQRREKWRKAQKIKRQNRSKEQKKIDSSKNYERYKARMRKAVSLFRTIYYLTAMTDSL